MKLKNSIFVALLVIGFGSNAFAESATITDKLKELRRTNEVNTKECDPTVKAVIQSAKEFLSEQASSGSKGNDETIDALHTIERQCEDNKDS